MEELCVQLCVCVGVWNKVFLLTYSQPSPTITFSVALNILPHYHGDIGHVRMWFPVVCVYMYVRVFIVTVVLCALIVSEMYI